MPFIPYDSHQILNMRGNETGYQDMPAEVVYSIAFSFFMASWSQFPHQQSWKPRILKITLLHIQARFLGTFYTMKMLKTPAFMVPQFII